MKNKLIALKNSFIILLFSTICFSAKATTYYISASGNDGNNGTSTSTPWQTLNKLNSFFSSLKPGDNVLLNRGNIFYGSIIIKKSGSSGSPITIGAYGSGGNPIITGFTTITAWTNLGSNIWESTSTVSALATCNMVVINGANIPMGRYPNSGYLIYQSFSGNTSITSSSLSGSPNWAGAEVVVRKNRWNIDRNHITSQSGSTLTFTPSSSTKGTNNFGFFIQNDARTLDVANEWYYNPSTKKLRIYNTSQPSNVKAASVDNLVSVGGFSYITLNNISFQGSNTVSIQTTSGGGNLVIQNCDFNYSGLSAVNTYPSSLALNISNCTFNNTNDFAINAGASSNSVITNNTIKNTGIYPGMGAATGGSFKAIHNNGNYNTISYNFIDSVGYNPIDFDGDGTIIRNNFINNFGFILDDGGGIYTYPSQGNRVYVQRSIKYNIILNGLGAGNGTDSPNANQQDGIYLDGTSPNCDIIGNSVVNVNSGLSLNNSHEVKLDSNTVYNCTWQYYLRNYTSTVALSNISFHNNILVASLSTQLATKMEVLTASLPTSYSSDYNYYARPIDDNLTIQNSFAHVFYPRTLAQWQAASGQDAHSKKSPKTITSVSDLRFEYNATTTSKTITLDANYIDVKGTSYQGSITLSPYTSAVLIRNGALVSGNIAPVADAGGDGTLTLPTNSVQLDGTGTDADGTITAYSWAKISGPSATIISPNSASTMITGMSQGTYIFQLTVTDNDGATGTSTVQMNVLDSVSSNIAPVADAGGNGTITLPANSVRLDGTGTDADGTITGYSWTKISGPSANIISPNSASTMITGMSQGTYIFQLTVTDNDGATGTSTVQMNVLDSASSNIAPVADAGGDGTLTLPTNSVQLDGTGTDADGTITAYSWAKISGPSANIISPNSASTMITGMSQGTYIFQLTLTDNDGATGTSTVQINVVDSASSNIAPVADAGGDGTLTLPTNSVRLDGTGTDADGTITAYSWAKISGPSANIISPNSASTMITGMSQGTYIFQLAVTDNDGATGTSTVQINVVDSASSNIAPVADAGGDGTITLPANSVRLDGTGTDADGTITGYSWTKISGPSANISSPNSASTNVTGMTTAGTYVFQLTVTDNKGATGTSTVQINILNSASSNNIAPVADAGGDGTLTLPTNSVRLDGTGTDADGTITAYSWTKISGPSANISSPNSASTNITGMTTVGTYIFQITVTDNDGATGTSRVQINVVNSSLSVSLPSITNTEIAQVPSSLIVTAYPNPFINTLNITITGEAAKYKLIVMNAVGETMLVKVGNKNNGTTQLVIDGSKFSRGVYFLTLIQNNQSSTVKLEKQ